jgi:aspartate-semialdehyde dehydrogenase
MSKNSNPGSANKLPVAVLAGTGAVGQRFVSLLENHPWFEVVAVTGSERSAGRLYGEAVNWVVPGDPPPAVAELTVRPNTPDFDVEVAVVFSALPSGVAREVEPDFAAAGYAVCSNASAYRMAPDVPLLIPEINPSHIGLIEKQRAERGWSGLLVASPNCSTTGVIFPLKALDDAFGLTQVHAVTLQAISGAGYPGVASLDILDNVLPYIGGEEDKVENEPRKLLGRLGDGEIIEADVAISAQTNRVPVIDGHLACLSIGFEQSADAGDALDALRDWRAPDETRTLPSAPEHALIVRDEPDRPQPRLDRDAEDGMAVTVGRVQACDVLDVKLVSLVHNTLRGAASGAILNAEFLVAQGLIEAPALAATISAEGI